MDDLLIRRVVISPLLLPTNVSCPRCLFKTRRTSWRLVLRQLLCYDEAAVQCVGQHALTFTEVRVEQLNRWIHRGCANTAYESTVGRWMQAGGQVLGVLHIYMDPIELKSHCVFRFREAVSYLVLLLANVSICCGKTLKQGQFLQLIVPGETRSHAALLMFDDVFTLTLHQWLRPS